MATLVVYVDCMDKSPVDVIRIEHDGFVSEVIEQVRNKRALYHVDCLAVEAFSGDNQLPHTTRINEVLESGCGSEENPLKLKFCKCITIGLVLNVWFNDCVLFWLSQL